MLSVLDVAGSLVHTGVQAINLVPASSLVWETMLTSLSYL